MPSTLVATHNVLRELPRPAAGAALDGVIEHAPDLVGLQEWNLSRLCLLRARGSVGVVPGPGIRMGRGGGYLWATSLLRDCVVGARAERYDQLETGSVLLGGVRRCDNPSRPLGLEPPRFAVVGVYRDRADGAEVALLSYHLAPGVQGPSAHPGADDYRHDRPLLVARHRAEVARLQRIVDDQLAAGRVVYAAGDSNFDGLRLRGLTSAWQGHVGASFGGRRIDDVFGPGPADSLEQVQTPSDHRALLVSRGSAD